MKDRTAATELYELSRVVPEKFVQRAPQGKFGHYVPHYVIVQWLLATVGPFDWELVEVLRGDSKGTVKNKNVDLHDVIVGVVYRLTCTIDGRKVSVEEVGEVDAYTKSGDGARLKHCTSDALKRCAMRLGVAIQLWCKEPVEHFLPEYLNRDTPVRDTPVEEDEGETVVGGEDQDEPDTREDVRGYAVFDGESLDSTVVDHDKTQFTLTDTPKITPPPDTWNQLLATLENLPSVTDMKPVWLKYAKQLTGLMIMAGLWNETEGDKLTGLDKKALVEKVTEAHKQATKKAGDHAPF